MTDHPITPPPELVEQWSATVYQVTGDDDERDSYIATQAARWGADQELEACCEWLANARNHTLSWNEATNYSANLHHARRPKPPSLKEQALDMLSHRNDGWAPSAKDWDTIRRALQELPND